MDRSLILHELGTDLALNLNPYFRTSIMASDQGTTWFIAQLKPNSARIAERNLHRQGFETFLPMVEETHRRADAFITKTVPLFPGYIFVALDVTQGLWRKVNSTYGVSRLVAFGSAPTPIPDELIVAFQQRYAQGDEEEPMSPFSPGDQVRVASGPFADFAAEIETIDPDRRVWVLMELMGRQTRVAVEPRHLKPL
jgi:transcriptional antiterminator RfaH